MRQARPIGAILAAAARAEAPLPVEAITGIDPDALLGAAIHHRIVGLLQERLDVGLSPSFDATLACLALHARAHHLRAVADVHDCGDVLDAAGVPWLVVKGPALAEAVYHAPGLRWYSDIDLVVPQRSFAAAVSSLRKAGAPVQDRNWLRVREQVAGQLNLLAPGGTALDLHWHLIFGTAERSFRGIDMDGVFRRARTVGLGGREVQTTDEVDTLLHVAMHACAEGADRIVWLKDVERVVTCWAPDWDEVVRRAHAWRVAPAVGLVLGRARRTIGLDVPREVRRALVPSITWRATRAAVDWLAPVERSVGRVGSPASLLARSTGPTAWTSTAAFARRLADRARWARRTRSMERPSGGAFPKELGSPYVATGSDADLEAFLADVVRGRS